MNRKKDPSRCTGQAASVRKYRTYHLVHCPHKDASASSGPVGGTDTGWLAEEVENLAPSIVAPGNRRSPTIRPITKFTKNCPSDSGLLVQGTEVPEHRGTQRRKDSGWRLWRYASSFKPPPSPAGASHSNHHEVNNHFSVP